MASPDSPKLPKLGPFPWDWYVDGGGRPPLEAGCGIGEGEVWGEVILGFIDCERPRLDWFANTAGPPMLGEVCWFIEPNWMLLGDRKSVV